MKRLLLDTHVFLWCLGDSAELGRAAAAMIVDPANEVYVSSASIWEAEIKKRLGKLSAPADLDAFINKMGCFELPITAYHAKQAASLPEHHKDPFDRMLIAQAQAEGLLMVTADTVFPHYGIKLLDARQ